MKPRLVLCFLATAVLALAAPVPKKPAPARTAPTVATGSVTSAVEAHYRQKYKGGTGSKLTLMSVRATVERTEPVPGWENRARSLGTVVLTIAGSHGIGKSTETHSFDVLSEGGKILDVSVN
jgi:hypothetical protein